MPNNAESPMLADKSTVFSVEIFGFVVFHIMEIAKRYKFTLVSEVIKGIWSTVWHARN